ncbi:hypothetical protein [Aminobacter sp. AP02]|uniref:hypothetical protein n=1 Tax=Aminobacter sp. AP02 TaxID=2135737 RepID=UPI000D6C955D|nr:hypothetical protein [Aminobacter sp. AP02]PWK76081.1 hypothetical protein C8K44_10267 [Aminobacter sp. AP02]
MNPAIMALPLAVFTFSAAIADEKDFLETLSGNWHGSGQIRLKPEAMEMAVSCNLDSRADGAEFKLDGACRAKAVFSRHIGVDLIANGQHYSGSYLGSVHGPAELTGTRSGDTLNLKVRWPDRGSGPRVASMRVANLGTGRMRIVTVEAHPRTGVQVETARIEFSRN